MLILDKSLEKKWDELLKIHCSARNDVKHSNDGVRPKSIFQSIPTVGFLIGSSRFLAEKTEQCFHLSLCALPETVSSKEESNQSMAPSPVSAADCMDEDWIIRHSRQLMRMLPGGIEVIGIFLLADKVAVKLLQPVLIKCLRSIAINNSEMNTMSELPDLVSMYLVTQETPLGKPQALLAAVSAKGVQGTSSTRINYQALHWKKISATVSLDFLASIPKRIQDSDFQAQFLSALQPFAHSVISARGLINGKILPYDEPLVPKQTGKEKKHGSATTTEAFEVDLLVKASVLSKMEPEASVERSAGSLKLGGTLKSYGAVGHKGTVEEAIMAIKQDIIRSLYSRCELHYEGMMVIEGEEEDRSSIHQFPRRVYVPHPVHSSVILSDYLFEGDTREDALESFADLLQLDVTPEEICDDIEKPPTAEILAKFDVPTPDIEAEKFITSTERFQAAEAANRKKFDNWPILYSVLAFLVGLLSYVIYLVLFG